jgi:hypothetical protein
MGSVILIGTLVDDGGAPCDCGFQWGLTAAYGDTTDLQLGLTTGATITQTLTQAADGLLPNTAYHFRAFATNVLGTSYGADIALVTGIGGGWGGVPNMTDVATLPATDIAETHATLNGLLVNDDGQPCSCWFQYGSTSAYGQTTDISSGITMGNTFLASIIVGEGKAIHFRAVAQNGGGIVYGADASFSSLSYLGPVTVAVMEDLTIGEGE